MLRTKLRNKECFQPLTIRNFIASEACVTLKTAVCGVRWEANEFLPILMLVCHEEHPPAGRAFEIGNYPCLVVPCFFASDWLKLIRCRETNLAVAVRTCEPLSAILHIKLDVVLAPLARILYENSFSVLQVHNWILSVCVYFGKKKLA